MTSPDIIFRKPQRDSDFESYFRLRWEVLRMPLGMPEGSERDELEATSIHLMAIHEGTTVAVGRLHLVEEGLGQVRYMAVDPTLKGKGLGRGILFGLEQEAFKIDCNRVFLNARADVSGFYAQCGYLPEGGPFVLLGNLPHQRMYKDLIG